MILTFLSYKRKELEEGSNLGIGYKKMNPKENLVTKKQLITQLVQLGIKNADTLIIHVSLKRIGWLVGGPEILIQAIQEIIGQNGNLIMYVGWEDGPYTMRGWSEEKKEIYRKNTPGFNPKTSRATIEFSLLAEVFRTLPDVKRSLHPDGSFSAWGKDSDWIVSDHSFHYGYGEKSPLKKFLDLDGKIVLIGAPLGTATFLHYVESVASLPNKRKIQYSMPIAGENGKVEWVEIEEYDTELGIVNYNGDYFEDCVKDYISFKDIHHKKIGSAPSYLFDSKELFPFAKRWMESKLG